MRPYRATERQGARTAEFADFLAADSPNASATPPEVIWLDDVFQLVEKAIVDAEEMQAQYDTSFGYPTQVTIDWSLGSIDDDISIYIRDFEVIEYSN